MTTFLSEGLAIVGLAKAKMFLKGIATEILEAAGKLSWGARGLRRRSWRVALEELGNLTSCAARA